MHTSGGAACGRDDDGGPGLWVCQSLWRTKIKDYSPRVNGRTNQDQARAIFACGCVVYPGILGLRFLARWLSRQALATTARRS